MRIANCVTGLGFLAFSLAYYFFAAALPASPSYGDPGPAELPKLIAGITAVVAVVLIVQSLGDKAVQAAKTLFPRPGVVLLAWSILAAIALPFLHTPLTLAIYVFGGILMQSGRSSLRIALVSTPLIAGAVYALFKVLLGVPLP